MTVPQQAASVLSQRFVHYTIVFPVSPAGGASAGDAGPSTLSSGSAAAEEDGSSSVPDGTGAKIPPCKTIDFVKCVL